MAGSILLIPPLSSGSTPGKGSVPRFAATPLHGEFFSISSPPSFAEIRSALPKLLEFEPDVIVGVGGGSAMSAAKALWALYEDLALDPAEAAAHPERIRTGAKAKLVLVAASFGSGAQNSPFAVLKDDSGGLWVLCSPALLPELSVTDAQFTATLSPAQVKACGLAVLSRSLGALAAADEDAYGRGMLGEAVRLVLENLSAAEAGRPDALERLRNAGALMGAAAAEPDPAAPFWPAEPKGLEPLARELGFPDVPALQKACEARL